MPTYKVTEKKIEEYLGDSVKSYFNPLKGKESWKFFVITGFMALIFLLFAALSLHMFLVFQFRLGIWLFVFNIVFLIGILIVWYKIQKSGYLDDCAEKIKYLVNDPGLLWLNARKTNYPERDEIGRWRSKNKGKLVATTFEMLAYLKKEGSSQGIYNKIKSLRSSSSARRVLKRLADKTNFDHPIVDYNDGDFKYAPWKFQLVDARGIPINNLESQKIEDLLEKAWEKMLDEEARKWE